MKIFSNQNIQERFFNNKRHVSEQTLGFQFKCGKIRTRKTANTDTFCAVFLFWKVYWSENLTKLKKRLTVVQHYFLFARKFRKTSPYTSFLLISYSIQAVRSFYPPRQKSLTHQQNINISEVFAMFLLFFFFSQDSISYLTLF